MVLLKGRLDVGIPLPKLGLIPFYPQDIYCHCGSAVPLGVKVQDCL